MARAKVLNMRTAPIDAILLGYVELSGSEGFAKLTRIGRRRTSRVRRSVNAEIAA